MKRSYFWGIPMSSTEATSIDVPSKAKARSVARRGRASDSSGERRTAMATELCLEMSWDGRHGMGWGVEMMICGMWKYVNYRMIAVVPPKKDRKGISATFGLNFAFVFLFGLLYLSTIHVADFLVVQTHGWDNPLECDIDTHRCGLATVVKRFDHDRGDSCFGLIDA